MEYIALDRRFIEFGDTEDAEEAAAESLHYQIFGQEIKWRDLYSRRFVVEGDLIAIVGDLGTVEGFSFRDDHDQAEAARALGLPELVIDAAYE